MLGVCEVCFALDLLLHILTVWHATSTTRRTVRLLVRSSQFWVDVGTLVPFSVVLPRITAVPTALLEVHKLVRVLRMPQCLSLVDDIYAKHFVTVKLLKVLMVTVLLSHLIACARFLFEHHRATDDEWLPHHASHPHSAYLQSIFWAFGLPTGLFEGELPHTIAEFVFTIAVALCGFALFTYLCATFFMISRSEAGDTAMGGARINQFKHILAFHRVPENLSAQAIEYLKNFYTYADANDREAMRLLCPSISNDIQVELLKDTVARIPFFLGCSDQFLIAITSLLDMVSLPANAAVFQIGDRGDSMYIVNSGVLYVLAGGIKIKELRKGSYFGEMAIFLDRPRSATVLTATYTTLYKLLRVNVERVLEGYPRYAKSIPKKVEVLTKALSVFSPRKPQLVGTTLSDAEPPKKSNLLSVVRLSLERSRKAAQPQQNSDSTATSPPTQSAGPPAGHRLTTLLRPIQSQRQLLFLSRLTTQNLTASQDLQPRRWNVRDQALLMITRLQELRAWHYLHPEAALDRESAMRMWWLLALQVVLLYNWTLVPLQLAFDLLDTSSWLVVLLNAGTDLLLWLDLYGNHFLSFTENSEKIVDIRRTARRYARTSLLLDVLCVLPYDALATNTVHHAFTRVPRLLRVWRVVGHYREVDDFVQLTNRHRLGLFALLLVVLCHIVACLYFCVTYIEGFALEVEAEGSWLPAMDVGLRRVNVTTLKDAFDHIVDASNVSVGAIAAMQYTRSLYYASNILTGLGRTIEPATDTQYVIALAFMLTGFVITAVVVDNVQRRCTASAPEHREFLVMRLKIQHFLHRQNAPVRIHRRVNAFLDFWWSAHRGAVISEILNELPESIRRDVMRSVCGAALRTLALLAGVRPVLERLEDAFLHHVQFVLYGQGEVIYNRGDYATGIFVLLEGTIVLNIANPEQREVLPGGFFNIVCLHEDAAQLYCVDTATATTGCVVLFLAKENLAAMSRHFPTFCSALVAFEKRLLGPKMAKSTTFRGSHNGSQRGRLSWTNAAVAIQDGIALGASLRKAALDPDSTFIGFWEVVVFAVMTVQSVRIVFLLCFDGATDNALTVESTTFVLEMIMLLDIAIRARLGFYEFGNKVMDRALIRRRYMRSPVFVVDVVAILPMFLYNWIARAAHRTQAVNVLKLVRLAKVPLHLTALDATFRAYSTELRLAKLAYYTFLLSHVFGCIWFAFRDWNGEHNLWRPPHDLEHAPLTQQYLASLFWAFGLMSASSPGELPKSTLQSLFSVLTMNSGFFLFAYVVGNFSDVIELHDAENRVFYANLSALRHFRRRFRVAKTLAHKFKMYFCFRRFHSITQEHLLERCLPPSLLTDVRMVHLHPMLLRVSFLAGMDASITHMLVAQFTQLLVVRDEFVYRLGDQGSGMYFVFSGLLHALLPEEEMRRHAAIRRASGAVTSTHMEDRPSEEENAEEKAKKAMKNDSLRKIAEHSAGGYFGENALLSVTTRSAYVRARTSCILYTLSRHSLEHVFQRYPEWKERVLRSMQIHQEQQILEHLAREEMRPQSHQLDRRRGITKLDMLNAVAARSEVDLVKFMRTQGQNPMGHQGSARSHSVQMMASHMRAQKRKRQPRLRWLWQAVVTLFQGAKAQSMIHLRWIRLVLAATLYVAIIVPYRIAFDELEVHGWGTCLLRQLEILCDVIYIADVFVNCNVAESLDSMELYEQDPARAYRRERMTVDVVAFIPFDYLLSNVGRLGKNPWLRLNRCLKMGHYLHYTRELHRQSSSIELPRLAAAAGLYVVLIYWTACIYFIISTKDGFGHDWDDWVPSKELQLNETHGYDAGNETISELRARQLLRGLFFATTALVKKGRTFVPSTSAHLLFTILSCFAGLLLMAFMLGDIAALLISYIGHEVEFRKNHIAVELYLSRWKISPKLRTRAHAYLASLWASHRGVDYQRLLEEVPLSISTEAMLVIANWPLTAFTDDVLKPLESRSTMGTVLHSIAQMLRFQGYSRHESVIVEGSVAKAMYFVVHGHLCAHSQSNVAAFDGVTYKGGDYFGEKGLLGYSVSEFSVHTLRSCDLMALPSHSLLHALQGDKVCHVALEITNYALQAMRPHDPLPDVTAMETRWGETLLLAAKHRLELLKATDPDAMSHSGVHLVTIVTGWVNERPPDLVLSIFRPLLELQIPHGSLATFGSASQAAAKNSTTADVDLSFLAHRLTRSEGSTQPVDVVIAKPDQGNSEQTR
ncbi:TPA: hypothetical protein N0F65_001780 [Lagenidium giganteum]|uniref:Cyclic nucleotide-binding domain-containing protein n=1 Tax=Lagenidium giganteum TaxID=4803 RepID=A0AAV2YHB1_9STRA|nr:TPA: hypothetical protein N0F65_001780 [Lagenidium giganteum]